MAMGRTSWPMGHYRVMGHVPDPAPDERRGVGSGHHLEDPPGGGGTEHAGGGSLEPLVGDRRRRAAQSSQSGSARPLLMKLHRLPSKAVWERLTMNAAWRPSGLTKSSTGW